MKYEATQLFVESAATLFTESLALSTEIGNRQQAAFCLVGFAGVAAAQGNMEQGARLLGAAQALMDEIGCHLQAADRRDYEGYLTTITVALNETSFALNYEEGRRMPLHEGVMYLMEVGLATSYPGATEAERF
jgi:hypothetical protein